MRVSWPHLKRSVVMSYRELEVHFVGKTAMQHQLLLAAEQEAFTHTHTVNSSVEGAMKLKLAPICSP